MSRRAVIVSAVRTPVGRYAGALSAVRPDDLAALAIRTVIERGGIDPATVEDVYFGAANQAGEDNRNVARMAGLLAGLPDSVPGATVNRLCASGLEAINLAARLIETGHFDQLHTRRQLHIQRDLPSCDPGDSVQLTAEDHRKIARTLNKCVVATTRDAEVHVLGEAGVDGRGGHRLR